MLLLYRFHFLDVCRHKSISSLHFSNGSLILLALARSGCARPRPRAPRLQLVGRPPVVEVEAPQVKSRAELSRGQTRKNNKNQKNKHGKRKTQMTKSSPTLIFDNHVDTQRILNIMISTNIGRLDQKTQSPCRPVPPRPLSAASRTAVCWTMRRSVAAARSATHGCR